MASRPGFLAWVKVAPRLGNSQALGSMLSQHGLGDAILRGVQHSSPSAASCLKVLRVEGAAATCQARTHIFGCPLHLAEQLNRF